MFGRTESLQPQLQLYSDNSFEHHQYEHRSSTIDSTNSSPSENIDCAPPYSKSSWSAHMALPTSIIEGSLSNNGVLYKLRHGEKLALVKLAIMLWSQYDYCTRLIPINVNVAQTNAIRTLQRLEALEFVGYTGCEYAVALAYHLTQHAPMLKKFILDPRIPEQVGELSNWYLNYKGDYLEIARSRAKLLAKLIKSSVNVVIL
uniref:Uncharacterized protein n=1 Tax=Chenopodium quinoa TaxID=63459 RepID=A0A803MHQ5_CHEQI